MWRRFFLTLWWTARILAFVFIVVLGFRPPLLAYIGFGQAMIEWLTQPQVLVPLVAVLTLLICDWLVAWRLRQRQKALQRLGITYDLPVRQAFKYLRFESEWASQMRSADECVLSARDALEDAFSSNAMFVWGRNMSRTTAALESILPSPRFWMGTTLNGFSLSDFYEAPNADTNRAVYHSHEHRFRDLHVSRRQIEDRWPRASWSVRQRLRRTMGHPAWDADAKARSDRRLRHRATLAAYSVRLRELGRRLWETLGRLLSRRPAKS